MKTSLLLLALISNSLLMGQKTDSLPAHVYNWNTLNTITEGDGITRIIMEGGTTSLADFEVHATTIEPGKTKQSHTYNGSDELIVVKDGRLKFTLNGESKMLSSGSIAFAIAFDKYVIENPDNTSATYYAFKYKSKTSPNPERSKPQSGSFMINRNDVAVVNTDKGFRREYFNRSTSQLAKFEMHTTALNPGFDSHAPHTHIEEEIILIGKGIVEIFIAGSLFKASPGDVIFLSSGVSHALRNTGKVQCEYFAFQWRN